MKVKKSKEFQPLKPGIYYGTLTEVDTSLWEEFCMKYNPEETDPEIFDSEKPYINLVFSIEHDGQTRKLSNRVYIMIPKTNFFIEQAQKALGISAPETDEEFEFLPEKWAESIGTTVKLYVAHRKSGDKVYENITKLEAVTPDDLVKINQNQNDECPF